VKVITHYAIVICLAATGCSSLPLRSSGLWFAGYCLPTEKCRVSAPDADGATVNAIERWMGSKDSRTGKTYREEIRPGDRIAICGRGNCTTYTLTNNWLLAAGKSEQRSSSWVEGD
jgi:hypothetical protein